MNNRQLAALLAYHAPMTREEALEQEFKRWMASPERAEMLDAGRYYAGRNDILQRERSGYGLADCRIPHNFVRELVDQKVQYLLGKPFCVLAGGEYGALLRKVFDRQFARTLKNAVRDAVNKGIGWLHPYYDGEGRFRVARVPPEELLPLWEDGEHTRLSGALRAVTVEEWQGKTRRETLHLRYWEGSGVYSYRMEEGRLIPEGSAQPDVRAVWEDRSVPLNWARAPFIPIKYNDGEIPLLRFIRALVDDYDRIKSDDSNALADPSSSILVLRNYDGENLAEFRRNLAAHRAVKVSDDGAVTALQTPVNTTAAQAHLEMDRADIFEFGRGVDMRIDRLKNTASGVALRHEYADLDLDCNGLETELQAAMEELLWFVQAHFLNAGLGDFRGEPVEFVFPRDVIVNEEMMVDLCAKSVGMVSRRTLLANHPFTRDVDGELEELRREAAEQAGSLGGGTTAG